MNKNLACFIIKFSYAKIILKCYLYGGFIVELSTILMGIGIVCIIISFFLKDSSARMEKDLEELSISIYQETNSLKKRLKMVEEELLLEPNFTVKSPAPPKKVMGTPKQPPVQQKVEQPKVINEILRNQVIQLNKQGHTIEEISKMSTLSKDLVQAILLGGK